MVPLQEQVECLAREFRRRHKVFPGLVARGQLSQAEATAELARIEAARQTLSQLLGILGGIKKKGDGTATAPV